MTPATFFADAAKSMKNGGQDALLCTRLTDERIVTKADDFCWCIDWHNAVFADLRALLKNLFLLQRSIESIFRLCYFGQSSRAEASLLAQSEEEADLCQFKTARKHRLRCPRP